MRLQIKIGLILLILFLVSMSGSRTLSRSQTENRRIQFQIAAIEETGGNRKILSETTVEGKPGTDFNINLQTELFKMQARFLSDLIAPDAIKIRAKLNTRRLYGYSERQLPLYEEDAQSHALLLGFDETIVLLPFGRGGATETLKIEITPKLISTSPDKKDEPLKINIGKPDLNGEISVEAFKTPHRFEAEAVLLSDGGEIARGWREILLEDAGEIILQPSAGAEIPRKPLTAKLTVDKLTRSRSADFVSFKFNLHRTDGEGANVSNGAGIGALGEELIYRLDDSYFADGKKYELKFRIRLARGESAD